MMGLRQRQGFVLVAALWLLVAIGAVTLAASLDSRARRNVAANMLDRTRARAAAAAGVEYARSRLAAALAGRADDIREQLQRVQARNAIVFTPTMTEPWLRPEALVEPTLSFGDHAFELEVRDMGTLLNINIAEADELRNFFANGLGVDYALADRLAQRIVDWRDPDDIRRAGGAEREDYLRAGAIRLPTNRPFADVDELRYILGMPPDVFEAARPYLTTIEVSTPPLGANQINLNTAPEPVLHAIPGITPAMISTIMQMRESGQHLTGLHTLLEFLPQGSQQWLGTLARRVTFQTVAVMIEARGVVDGSPVDASQRVVVGNGYVIRASPGQAVVLIRSEE